MNGRIHYTECPVCDSKNINPLLTIKDFSVSKEEFVIWQCTNCNLRFTQDVPDENNIGVYYKSPDYISHTNTDKGFINKTYQKVRNYTLEAKAKLISDETHLKTGKLLDIGTGTGAFLNVMKNNGWNVKGTEPDEDARRSAKTLYGLDIEEPSEIDNIQDASFDAITLWHVLEHVHHLHDYLEHLKRILKPQGKLFIAVPNYQSRDSGIYRSYWAAYDVPRHLYHFAPKSIEVLMKKHGLKIETKKPMWFDSFYISMLSSKYKNGKTSYITAFINGVRSNVAALLNKERCSSIIYIISKN
jgi:2-polyprenyl-3-methyl-5-hydroxy-6-metoxy-1,4-benzoquinol methylase